MHQKQPPAKVAMAAPGGTAGRAALGFPFPAAPFTAGPLPTTSATPTATASAVMTPRRSLIQGPPMVWNVAGGLPHPDAFIL